MYKTRKEVDGHVRTMLQKLKTDAERNLRSYAVAKLYYKVGEYDIALKFLSNYLTEKDDNHQAHKLMGQCYQRLQKPEKALQSFQRSLQLNQKQPDLLAEVCKLLLEDKNMNVNKANYWCQMAESEKVHDEAIFSLRLKILNDDTTNSNDVESLIQKGITSRPNDVQLRVRLVRHYIEQNKIIDAFKYVYNLEMTFNAAFAGSGEWYNVVRLVLNKYEQLSNTKKDWEFWLLLILCLERQVNISFTQSSSGGGGATEIANLLFLFDQYLYKLSNCSSKLCNQEELVSVFLDHYSGQLLLHSASLLFKREMLQNKNKWKETVKMALPLLLLAYQMQPPINKTPWMKHCNEQANQLIQQWSREGSFRCAQAGLTLLSCVKKETAIENESANAQVQSVFGDQCTLWKSESELIAQIRQTCSDKKQWRHNIFSWLFCNSDQKMKENSSFFAGSSKLMEPASFELPTFADVEHYEEVAQYFKPQSLEHMVYLCLGKENLSHVRAKYFSGLNFSTQNLSFCGAESLNQLDVDTFLYAASIQAQRMLDVDREHFDIYVAGNQRASGKPGILPFVNLQGYLCTEEQASWWDAAYHVYKNLSIENLAEVRANLQFGIEAVRGINGPKIDMIIVFALGQIFVSRAEDTVKPVEKALLEARVENLFRYGLNMVKMNGKGVLEPFRKYFKYTKANTSVVERQLELAAEQAVSWLGSRFFKKGDYEGLIEELSGVQLPFATYLQAEAYRKMDELNKTPRKAKQMYLNRASDCLNQTLALLKSTQTNPNHPLNAIIHDDIRRLQQQVIPRLHNDSISSANNDSSTYEDAEAAFSPINASVYTAAGNRSRRENAPGTLVVSPAITELESLVKQMVGAVTFVKEELVETLKPEIVSMRKEISSLKDKINELEDAMKKVQVSSNPPSRDDPSNVLDDLYIIDDVQQNPLYQSQQQQQQQSAHIPNSSLMYHPSVGGGAVPMAGLPNAYLQQQQRLHSANPMQLAAAAAYSNQIFNPNYGALSYYNPQYMQAAAAGGTGGILGQRNLMAGPFMDPAAASASFNMAGATLLPPQANQDVRQGSLYGLLNQPQTSSASSLVAPVPTTPIVPSLSSASAAISVTVSLTPSSAPTVSVAGTPNVTFGQFNKTISNKPVEKGPPANVVITSSDPLPNPVNYSLQGQQPTLSVTIPSHHIKANVVPTSGVIMSTSSGPSQVSSSTPGALTFGSKSDSGAPLFGSGSASNAAPAKTSFFGLNNISTPLFGGAATSTAFSFKDKIEEANIKATNNVVDEPSYSDDDEANRSAEADVEYDPRPDFQAIIPLPDEVEAKTGEEDEEVKFCYRAKLYRLVDKEWKERGIGDIKILKNKEGASRLVMRREQTFKIAANHKITSDIKFNAANNDNRGFIWAAPDFADEEVKLETFFVRFKLEDTAKEFRAAFEKAQQESKACEKPKAETREVAAAPVPAVAGVDKKQDKPAATAAIPNFGLATKTGGPLMTSTPLQPTGGLLPKPVAVASSAPPSASPITSTVKLKISKFENLSFATKSAASTTTATPSPFANLFGKPSESPFGSASFPAFKPPTSSGVTGSPFGTAAANENTGGNKSTASDAEDDYVPTAQFNPVIPLPDLIEVTTGEENETILFEHRAKLLRFVKETSEWKERGIGNMKVLQDKNDPDKVRLIMRREQIHKLCCNQRLYKNTHFNYAKNSQTALVWAGPDYSENELVTETLSVRFKTSDVARQFLDTILAVQAKMSDSEVAAVNGNDSSAKAPGETAAKTSSSKAKEEPAKGFGDAFKPKAGSWDCQGCYVSNPGDKLYCAACDAPKDDTVPKKPAANILGNVSNTFTFGFPAATAVSTAASSNSSAAPSGGLSFSFGGPAVTQAKATASSSKPEVSVSATPGSGFGDAFKPKAGSWDCQSCYVTNAADAKYCLACESPKDDTLPKKPSNSNILALSNPSQKFSFGFGAAATTASPATTTSSTPSAAPLSFSSNVRSESSSDGMSLGKPSFSFAMPSNYGQSSAGSEFSLNKKDFSFSMKPKSPAEVESATDDGEDGSYHEEEENNSYFTPAIPLPDKVDVKTGEEDETVLYSHRAKLFRFTDGEWKERGIGDVKILRHKEHQTLRVVMRREQVLKICLNHALNDKIEYKSKGDNAWLFAANDFSEGEFVLEAFTLRFKTKEIAQEFMDAVKSALSGAGLDAENAGASASAAGADGVDKVEEQAVPLDDTVKEEKEEKEEDAEANEESKEIEALINGVEVNLPMGMPKLRIPKPVTAYKPSSLLKQSALASVVVPPAPVAAPAKSTTDAKLSFSFAAAMNDVDKEKENSGEFLFGSSSFGGGGGGDKKPVFGQAPLFGNAAFDKTKSIFGGTGVVAFGQKPLLFGGGPTFKSSSEAGGDADTKPTLFGVQPFNANQNKAEGATSLFGGSTLPSAPFAFGSSVFGGNGAGGDSLTKSKTSSLFGIGSKTDDKPLTFADLAKSPEVPDFASLAAKGSKDEKPTTFADLFSKSAVTDFAALASKNNKDFGSAASDTASSRGFIGLTNEDSFSKFGNANKNKSSNEKSGNVSVDGGNDDTITDEDYDPHYEPIIELPQEVNYGTGEEDETKLFGERASLYRYDDVNKEWKERGVGEIKILFNPKVNGYRLIMRREQVHKLVLNHQLTADIKFSNMNNNPKSFIWGCLNFAEEDAVNGKLEKLAVRFKKLELAEQFKKTIHETMATLKSHD